VQGIVDDVLLEIEAIVEKVRAATPTRLGAVGGGDPLFTDYMGGKPIQMLWSKRLRGTASNTITSETHAAREESHDLVKPPYVQSATKQTPVRSREQHLDAPRPFFREYYDTGSRKSPTEVYQLALSLHKMAFMKTESPNPDDPFAGFGPQAVRCKWLSAVDAERARTAKVVRLVVDGNRWSPHWANEVYQRHALRDVSSFLGPTTAVVTTPAGMVTTTVAGLKGDIGDVSVGRTAALAALKRLDLGPSAPETLLGIDGVVPGEATPLQCVVRMGDGPIEVNTLNTTMKLYPNNGESRSLIGWIAACDVGSVPVELMQARRIRTKAGEFLVLVCHDACLFSARSRANLGDWVGLRIREHFELAATADPRPDFVLVATHYQDTPRSGGVFKNAASVLADVSGATVVTTTFAEAPDLESIASHFPTRGDRADQVVTLLVEDTFVS
jgi:hypothetical protein